MFLYGDYLMDGENKTAAQDATPGCCLGLEASPKAENDYIT